MTKRRVLLIYTGGTIGMKKDYEKNILVPFDFNHIQNEVPELIRINCELSMHSFEKPIDSSDMSPVVWQKLAILIGDNYNKYDGFVVLHGSDTMAYSASALSFMLENLDKPVVFTGSQLPIGTLRTDGKENLITAIEIAAAYENDRPKVPEVSIYFEYSLYRGNRSRKVDAEQFRAFETLNYPLLAEAGVNIQYNEKAISKVNSNISLSVFTEMNNNVGVLKLFPGIHENFYSAVLNSAGLKGMILESFGSGNAPNDPKLLSALKKAIAQGMVVVNITQCHGGSVHQTKYFNGKILEEIGVISGRDMTTEAAVTKLMYLLGKHNDVKLVRKEMMTSLRGEMTITVA